MILKALGHFFSSLFVSEKSEPTYNNRPKGRNYEAISDNFTSAYGSVDRIVSHIDQLNIHQRRINNLTKIMNRIDEIKAFMKTYEFKKMEVDYPNLKKEMNDEIEDLFYKAKSLMN